MGLHAGSKVATSSVEYRPATPGCSGVGPGREVGSWADGNGFRQIGRDQAGLSWRWGDPAGLGSQGWAAVGSGRILGRRNAAAGDRWNEGTAGDGADGRGWMTGVLGQDFRTRKSGWLICLKRASTFAVHSLCAR